MNYQVGIDSERIDRFKVDRYEHYTNKFLSKEEVEYFNTLHENKKQKFIASRFCAKEAIFKALGIGISTAEFSRITILPNELGKPIVSFDGYDIELSITYNDVYVTTFVILKKL